MLDPTDYLWCDTCEALVDSADHRCEQWSTIIRIPQRAINFILNRACLRLIREEHGQYFDSMKKSIESSLKESRNE